jgi:flagellar assembly protein FliH
MFEQAKAEVRPMEYRTIAFAELGSDGFDTRIDSLAQDLPSPGHDELEARIRELSAEREQEKKAFQSELSSVREQAFQAGRKSFEEEHSNAAMATSERLVQAIEEFRVNRDRYLAQVEREVVQLSLAIAERILHRETQIDPLLLSGAVRVALGQLAESTEVRLKVPLAERDMWAELLRLMPNLPLRPELTIDEKMTAGECTIETHLGTIDIGVRAQLAEIERGFFDLLEHRERVAPDMQPTAG